MNFANRRIVLIAHNIRSCHNVGSLLRTAEGLGVTVYLTGYTPYPQKTDDLRLPHIYKKITQQIHKTALGAENTCKWWQNENVQKVIEYLKDEKFEIIAIEQTDSSISLPSYTPKNKLALIVGREVEGIESDVLTLSDLNLEIPMFGKKESFNVVQAAAMALYHCRFKK